MHAKKNEKIPPEIIMAGAIAAAELFKCEPFDIFTAPNIKASRARSILALSLYEEYHISGERLMNMLGINNTSAAVYISKLQRSVRQHELKWYKLEYVNYVRSKIDEERNAEKVQGLP